MVVVLAVIGALVYKASHEAGVALQKNTIKEVIKLHFNYTQELAGTVRFKNTIEIASASWMDNLGLSDILMVNFNVNERVVFYYIKGHVVKVNTYKVISENDVLGYEWDESLSWSFDKGEAGM